MPLASIDAFIEKFSGLLEEYTFYQGTETLRYDPKAHIYYLVTGDELIPLPGVSTVSHIIDKSNVLVPWAVKKMAQKLLDTTPVTITAKTQTKAVVLTWESYEKLVLEAKNAHKEKLEDAGAVGHMAHAWIENQIKAAIAAGGQGIVGKLPVLDLLPPEERAANCCLAAIDWMAKHNVRWICTERKVYSRMYRYAGTTDGLCTVDSCTDPYCCNEPFTDRLSLADWKSANGLYAEFLLQSAAYESAYEEEHGVDIVDRWIIRLGKEDAEFEPWHLTQEDFEDDFGAFLEALRLGTRYDRIEKRMKDRKAGIRAARKVEAKAAKEEALKLACKGAAKYQGKRKPACNQGSPCQSCVSKYQEVQAAKPAKPVKTKRVKSLTKENTNGEEVPQTTER